MTINSTAGNITQTGPALSEGPVTINNLVDDAMITLDDSANALSGPVSFNTQSPVNNTAHVTFDNTTTLDLASSTVAGDFTVTSGGVIPTAAWWRSVGRVRLRLAPQMR